MTKPGLDPGSDGEDEALVLPVRAALRSAAAAVRPLAPTISPPIAAPTTLLVLHALSIIRRTTAHLYADVSHGGRVANGGDSPRTIYVLYFFILNFFLSVLPVVHIASTNCMIRVVVVVV